MYNYLVQSGDVTEKHFRKYNYLSEMGNASSNVSSISTLNRENEAGQASYSTNSHVYRIKDLMDAINTSVIMDGKKKEEYIQMLSNTKSEVDTDNEFVSICRNLGECDIM